MDRSPLTTARGTASPKARFLPLVQGVAALLLVIALDSYWLEVAVADDTAALPPAANRAVDFVQDVRPIFVKSCYSCHGDERQESGYRLDAKAKGLGKGDLGQPISPGDSAGSPLIQYVAGLDRDMVMPAEGERLSAAEVGILRAWIDQGANWPDDADVQSEAKRNWSLLPLVRPAVPTAASAPLARTAIDRFVLAKLEANGLALSAPAEKRTLVRRVFLDLVGLQPTPQEVDEFLADASPDAYEKVVDRLLSSPRYGERWARHWMDVAHFAETHGNDEDRPRPNAWPYRDYLIRSFNQDKSYRQFVEEQVAGDALYPDEPQATVALGFLAAGPWDESSQMGILDGTVDKKIAQVLDRDDMIGTVMSAFCSVTVHCARCHNHKFDPIPQTDYYSLQAVFAGVDRAERPFDADPAVHARRLELAQRKRAVEALDVAQLTSDASLAADLTSLEGQFSGNREVWRVLPPTAVDLGGGATSAPQPDGSILIGGTRPASDTYRITLETDLDAITAVQLEVMQDGSLPHEGPGRQDNGNLHLSEFKLSAVPLAGGEGAPVPIAFAAADFSQQGWTIEHALDGDSKTAWGIYPEVGKTHSAVFVFREPLRTGGPVRLEVVLEQVHGGGHLIGRPRLSVTNAANPHAATPLPSAVAAALAIDAANRTSGQQLAVARFLLNWKLDNERSVLPPPSMVYAATSDFKVDGNFRPPLRPRPVNLLRRGDIHQPLDAASPGALSCVEGIAARFDVDDPEDEAARRAALAGWLVDPSNVLTWRSIVNRVWHYHFGRGICDTPNDLGKMGAVPSHPELLDWLAVDFRDGGGSLKRLHRQMVTSAAYRQASSNNADAANRDGDNRLLWRMNRKRLDAECIRDNVLAISGKLDAAMGGPSVKQFIQSPGIHVTPIVDYRNFDVDQPENYRRAIYRFLFRTLPDPFMESLDCPDASQMTPVRAQSVTALQALTMLNDRFLVRQSEHTATRLARMAAEPGEQIRLLFRFALCREPAREESERWQTYAAARGLANACRMMFNTNEFIFVD